MRLIDADKIQEEIKKCDGVACDDYGRGICEGIHRALMRINEIETFDLEKHNLEIRADERRKFAELVEGWRKTTDDAIELILTKDKSRSFDIEKHEATIRADERRKFAEWLTKSDYANGYFDTENGFVSVDKVLAEYEKEQKMKETQNVKASNIV